MLVAPFVGHNAFLRWSALQECAHLDPDDGLPRVWYVHFHFPPLNDCESDGLTEDLGRSHTFRKISR